VFKSWIVLFVHNWKSSLGVKQQSLTRSILRPVFFYSQTCLWLKTIWNTFVGSRPVLYMFVIGASVYYRHISKLFIDIVVFVNKELNYFICLWRQYSEDKYLRSLPAIFIFSSQKYASPRLTKGWWMLSSFHHTDLRFFFLLL
jgi:hypothetical protein